MSLIWYTSTDKTNWTLMKSPSTYKINWEDLDSDSYRSVVNGNLVRNVVKRRWAKVALSWRVIQSSDVDTILSAINKAQVYFKVISPAFGTSGFLIFEGYVSKMECELLDGMIGYSLSFNIVQSKGESWQNG